MLIGSHIGQYRIVREIAAGGMGLVFLGEHTLLGRQAAIKTLLPGLTVNPDIVERFFNEARATSAISDPGVIQIFDFGYHVDGTAYIVMELLEGEALSERIARLGTLPIADALRIARQGASSLATAHAQGVVHRDLKPANLYLVRDVEAQGGERVKILDFGICKVVSLDKSNTPSGLTFGTPAYMSPEQCRGAQDADHRSDIYAFGCLIFHMLTGRPPFVCEAPCEFAVAHLREEPPAPSEYADAMPPAVDALVLRCLAKSPDDRYQTMGELYEAIAEVSAQLAPEPAEVAVLPEPRSDHAVTPRDGIATRARSSPRAFATEISSPPVAELDPLEERSPRRSWVRAVVLMALIAAVAGVVTTIALSNGDGEAAPSKAQTVERPTENVAAPAPIAVTPSPPGAQPPPVERELATRGQTFAAMKKVTPKPRPRPTAARPPRPPAPLEDLYDTR